MPLGAAIDRRPDLGPTRQLADLLSALATQRPRVISRAKAAATTIQRRTHGRGASDPHVAEEQTASCQDEPMPSASRAVRVWERRDRQRHREPKQCQPARDSAAQPQQDGGAGRHSRVVPDLCRRDRPQRASEASLQPEGVTRRDKRAEDDRGQHDPEAAEMATQEDEIGATPPRRQHPEHGDKTQQAKGAVDRPEREFVVEAGQQRQQG